MGHGILRIGLAEVADPVAEFVDGSYVRTRSDGLCFEVGNVFKQEDFAPEDCVKWPGPEDGEEVPDAFATWIADGDRQEVARDFLPSTFFWDGESGYVALRRTAVMRLLEAADNDSEFAGWYAFTVNVGATLTICPNPTKTSVSCLQTNEMDESGRKSLTALHDLEILIAATNHEVIKAMLQAQDPTPEDD